MIRALKLEKWGFIDPGEFLHLQSTVVGVSGGSGGRAVRRAGKERRRGTAAATIRVVDTGADTAGVERPSPNPACSETAKVIP